MMNLERFDLEDRPESPGLRDGRGGGVRVRPLLVAARRHGVQIIRGQSRYVSL